MALAEFSFVTGAARRPEAFTERKADRAVVWLRGEHDVSTVDEVSETMARVIALDDADVVVDLSEVDFMGAATVHVVIGAREFLQSRSRSMALRSPSPSARRILVLCGHADLLDPTQ